MKVHGELGPKGKKLLELIIAEIARGRFVARQPETFLKYGEVLKLLRIASNGPAGQQLMREGLRELSSWTRENPAVPKMDGLIVDEEKNLPGRGFVRTHCAKTADWRNWWLEETQRAIEFDEYQQILSGTKIKYPEIAPGGSSMSEPTGKVDYRKVITAEPGKRGGRPCIRGMRIAVADVLGWLASGMSNDEILSDFPELTRNDILACLAFAAAREQHSLTLAA